MKNYRVIDHTADFGLHITGSDPADLFVNAAKALFDVLIEGRTLRAVDEMTLNVSGEDWPDLLVNWLRELLYLWAVKENILSAVRIDRISERQLSARLTCDRLDPERHRVKSEIKAVTYHQIQVTQGPDRWEGRVIFDV
jgi:SHS2 domain-containing protein